MRIIARKKYPRVWVPICRPPNTQHQTSLAAFWLLLACPWLLPGILGLSIPKKGPVQYTMPCSAPIIELMSFPRPSSQGCPTILSFGQIGNGAVAQVLCQACLEFSLCKGRYEIIGDWCVDGGGDQRL